MKKGKYSLPFQRLLPIRRCTAPTHKDTKDFWCIDFFMLPNTKVLAARGGVVKDLESRFKKSYRDMRFIDRCNFIIIAHSDGEETVYAHLAHDSLRVKKNQKVKRGQVIGLSGQTGYAWYPHLHFGIYAKNGKNIKANFNASLPKRVCFKKYVHN